MTVHLSLRLATFTTIMAVNVSRDMTPHAVSFVCYGITCAILREVARQRGQGSRASRGDHKGKASATRFTTARGLEMNITVASSNVPTFLRELYEAR